MKTKKTKTTQTVSPQNPNPMQEASVVFAPDFKSVYTNFVQGQFSPFDMSFMIGEALGPGPDGKQMVQQKVRITMAPIEAKILLMIIANAVQKYEEQFGKLSIPPGLMPTLGG